MITIYHNPKCSKSREGVRFLEAAKIEFEIIKYLDENLSKEELQSILKKLNYAPIQLVRTKEKIWIDKFKGKSLSDGEIIAAMVENPRLIERPIIVKGNTAIVARPVEKILEIL